MIYDLVFEGGGAKGFVLVGAYEEFVKRGHTHGRLLGTSAGAITAALMAASYTPQEMLAALNERNAAGRSVMAGFLGEPAPFTAEQVRNSAIRKLLKDVNVTVLPDFLEDKVDDSIAQLLAQNRTSTHLFSFVERGGWYSADNFVAWLRAKLDAGQWQGGQRNFSRMTLKEFFAATQVEFAVVASDTTGGRMLVLNHQTAPDCPLVMAVRMSMSIPLLWEEVIWQASWGTYRGRDITGHAIVDGGMLSNFPIELFLSEDRQVVSVMGQKRNTDVLGMLIDEEAEVPQPLAPAAGILLDVNVKPGELQTVRRLERIVGTAIGAHDKSVMDEYAQIIVRLPARGYGVVEFDLSAQRLAALLEAGRHAVAAYFDQPLPSAAAAGEAGPAVTPSSDVIDRRARDILA
jgi:predicted acylesterase/phospholipase RssA